MLIVCPSCASRYSIDDSKIGPAGRMVRCAGCRSDFFASPDEQPHDGEAERASSSTRQGGNDVRSVPPDSGPAGEGAGAPSLESEGVEPSPGAPPSALAASDRLDALFEQEMNTARREAEAAIEIIGSSPASPTPPAGWRRFLPMAVLAALSGRFLRRKSDAALNARHRSGPELDIETPQAREEHPLKGSARLVKNRMKRKPPSSPARLLGAARGPIGLGLAGCALIALAMAQREALVRFSPAIGSMFAAIGLPINVTGLVISDVTSLTRREGEVRLLVIEGRVANVRAAVTPVPLIEIRIRGEDGRAIYTWTAEPPQRSLKAGEALQFRTRLATPPEAGRDVELRFTDKARTASAGR